MARMAVIYLQNWHLEFTHLSSQFCDHLCCLNLSQVLNIFTNSRMQKLLVHIVLSLAQVSLYCYVRVVILRIWVVR